jgi:SAM-dependent methyltransferase
MTISHKELQQVSNWVERWSGLIQSSGKVLDLACGGGRHSIYLAKLGYCVDAIDRDTSVLDGLKRIEGITVIQHDLESNLWPFDNDVYDGVVVTNYLHRPLFQNLIRSIKSGGILIYETFSVGNEKFGKPSNPNFLLKPGELLEITREQFRVIAFEEVYLSAPTPAMVQRVCAQKNR